MKYELSLLSEWLNHTENMENTAAFQQEVSRIQQAWINAAIEGNDPAAFSRYIRLHQLELLHLMESCNPVENHPCVAAFEQLYLFLVERFPSESDCCKLVPVDHLPGFCHYVAQQLTIIREQCAKWKLHEKLSYAITEPLEKVIVTEPDNTIRTGRIRFIQDMLPAISQVFARDNDRELITKSLVDVLCHLNLNSVLFYKACCQLITEDVKAQQPKTGTVRLQRLQEHFNHLPVKNNMAYKVDAQTITTWIAGWISRQLSKTETSGSQPMAGKRKRIKLSEEDKIKTSLAIPELSTFLRLFFMTGVFINDNKKKVASFMATYVTSLATGAIHVRSAKNIYNKMFETDVKTLDSVERIIYRMQEKLQDLRKELDDRTTER